MTTQSNSAAHAIEMLYHTYQRPLAAYLARMIGDREAAEDLCQDTFFKALRGWHQHDPAANPVAWLYRIATNTAYDYLRRRRRSRLAPLIAAEGLAEACVLESHVDAREPVRSALAQLPPHYRAPCCCRSMPGTAPARSPSSLAARPTPSRCGCYAHARAFGSSTRGR
jgi:RNA polymerase sigma-70 factor (ECF subfamily)